MSDSHKADIDIARAAQMHPINEIGETLGIPSEAIYQYGPYKAKLLQDKLPTNNKDGKLILVTAISPTPAGEGKNHNHHRSWRCSEPDWQKNDHVPARTQSRACIWC